jgi:hypothetical protein
MIYLLITYHQMKESASSRSYVLKCIDVLKNSDSRLHKYNVRKLIKTYPADMPKYIFDNLEKYSAYMMMGSLKSLSYQTKLLDYLHRKAGFKGGFVAGSPNLELTGSDTDKSNLYLDKTLQKLLADDH